MKTVILLVACLLSFAIPFRTCFGDAYIWTDKDGVVHIENKAPRSKLQEYDTVKERKPDEQDSLSPTQYNLEQKKALNRLYREANNTKQTREANIRNFNEHLDAVNRQRSIERAKEIEATERARRKASAIVDLTRNAGYGRLVGGNYQRALEDKYKNQLMDPNYNTPPAKLQRQMEEYEWNMQRLENGLEWERFYRQIGDD